MGIAKPQLGAISWWRLDGIGILRIACGVVWGIDARFKWQPGFVDNFVSYLKGAQQGNPGRSTNGSGSGSTWSTSTPTPSPTWWPPARRWWRWR